MAEKITRREFLKVGGVAAVAASITGLRVPDESCGSGGQEHTIKIGQGEYLISCLGVSLRFPEPEEGKEKFFNPYYPGEQDGFAKMADYALTSAFPSALGGRDLDWLRNTTLEVRRCSQEGAGRQFAGFGEIVMPALREGPHAYNVENFDTFHYLALATSGMPAPFGWDGLHRGVGEYMAQEAIGADRLNFINAKSGTNLLLSLVQAAKAGILQRGLVPDYLSDEDVYLAGLGDNIGRVVKQLPDFLGVMSVKYQEHLRAQGLKPGTPEYAQEVNGWRRGGNVDEGLFRQWTEEAYPGGMEVLNQYPVLR